LEVFSPQTRYGSAMSCVTTILTMYIGIYILIDSYSFRICRDRAKYKGERHVKGLHMHVHTVWIYITYYGYVNRYVLSFLAPRCDRNIPLRYLGAYLHLHSHSSPKPNLLPAMTCSTLPSAASIIMSLLSRSPVTSGQPAFFSPLTGSLMNSR
jgi:hypothetical protein